MYTSYIGKKFLRLYNEREDRNYSAEEFFEKEFFSLFFNSEKHLMHVGNSPFFQKPKEEDIKKHGSKSLAQYNNLKKAIENDIPNMSIFVGSAAKDVGGTTSGQVSNIDAKTDKEEIYASWVGEALGIGVSGGMVMLIDESDILWSLYLGWKYYRNYLSQTPHIKDKQIEIWNGQWLWHISQRHYDENYPLDNLYIETSEISGNIAILAQQWIKVIFTLSRKYPNKVITAYSYKLDKTNTTLGFVNLYLPEVYKMLDIRDKILSVGTNSILSDEEINLFTTFYSYKNACKLGAIGLKAIEPAKLREYMPIGSIQYAQGKKYKFTNDESYTYYKLFKIWIIAMVNKIELLELATKIARILIAIETKNSENNRGKIDITRENEKFIDIKNRRDFIDGLTTLIKDTSEKEILKNTLEEILLLPTDLFPLFMALIRFEYSYLKK